MGRSNTTQKCLPSALRKWTFLHKDHLHLLFALKKKKPKNVQIRRKQPQWYFKNIGLYMYALEIRFNNHSDSFNIIISHWTLQRENSEDSIENTGISSVNVMIPGTWLEKNSPRTRSRRASAKCTGKGKEKEKETGTHKKSSFRDNAVVVFPLLWVSFFLTLNSLF